MTVSTTPLPPAALATQECTVAGHQVTGTLWRPGKFSNRSLASLADADRHLGNRTSGVYAFAWAGRRAPTRTHYERYLPHAIGGLYSGAGRDASGHRLSGAAVVFEGWFQVRDRHTLVRLSPDSGLMGLPPGVILVSFPPWKSDNSPDGLTTLPTKVRSEDLAWLAYRWMRMHSRGSLRVPQSQP